MYQTPCELLTNVCAQMKAYETGNHVDTLFFERFHSDLNAHRAQYAAQRTIDPVLKEALRAYRPAGCSMGEIDKIDMLAKSTKTLMSGEKIVSHEERTSFGIFVRKYEQLSQERTPVQ